MSLTGIAFLLAFMAGCVLAFARHPIFGLITYLGAFYLSPPTRWWGQGLLLEARWSLVAAVVTVVAILAGRHRLQPVRGFFREGLVVGFVLFIVWAAVQSFWAYDLAAHQDLLSYYLKFLVAMYMIYRCVDTEEHLRWFLWAHVLGCFYLGWIAYTTYTGGRFESFGGAGIGEANAGALQVVTGVLAAAALFLASRRRGKLAVVGVMPILVNAIVTTVSRSGFVALAFGGLFFNLFTPKRFRVPVRMLSLLGVVLLALLTSDTYWSRISTIKFGGEAVEGVDTGSGRLEIMRAQWLMFQAHPFGCGHMCTTILSPSYLDPRHLVDGGRASHNTFTTMLVDHGIPGGALYLAAAVWAYRRMRQVLKSYSGVDGLLPSLFPAIAGSLGAIFIADMFVQYPKFEARFWFLTLVMVLAGWAGVRARSASLSTPT